MCFSSEDSNCCADCVVVLQGMESFILCSKMSVGGRSCPCFNNVSRGAAPNLACNRARQNQDLNIPEEKRKLNASSRSDKKAIAGAKPELITRFEEHIGSLPAGSQAFWSLSNVAQGNFCHINLPPLHKSDDSLAHSAKEKAYLLVHLLA